MKSLLDSKPDKGMVFAGCSFTWGQGLYYYSNLDTLAEPLPDHYDRNLVRHAHIKFKESVRYPILVATNLYIQKTVVLIKALYIGGKIVLQTKILMHGMEDIQFQK